MAFDDHAQLANPNTFDFLSLDKIDPLNCSNFNEKLKFPLKKSCLIAEIISVLHNKVFLHLQLLAPHLSPVKQFFHSDFISDLTGLSQ